MCLVVYIASSVELPLEWADRAGPPFDVDVPVFVPEDTLRHHFSKPHVYRACVPRGCGCQFLFEGRYDDDGEFAADDASEPTALHQGLADYLTAALAHQPVVEVLTCCSGDEPFPATSWRSAQPADFVNDRTMYKFGERVDVSLGAASAPAGE